MHPDITRALADDHRAALIREAQNRLTRRQRLIDAADRRRDARTRTGGSGHRNKGLAA
ncbi:hypothetical protein [Nocardiopsis ansamitocini]|uniref:Uncharacterized protein n=1 Tax=Nocardiopsis ansamitocini TaxID=1670832 RepID=A0A9W6UFY1_9ACTN|nr:hypothetical protein [Nocardiopsis ansamitocini]GLU46126.1 hypothetical protein Nans01_04770 [Nocardiopsis ansamitocini]